MLEERIKDAIKSNKAIIGFKEGIKFIKLHKPKLVIIANNIPEGMKREIEYNSKLSGVKVEVFPGSSKQLGILCGKPFPISTIVIRE